MKYIIMITLLFPVSYGNCKSKYSEATKKALKFNFLFPCPKVSSITTDKDIRAMQKCIVDQLTKERKHD